MGQGSQETHTALRQSSPKGQGSSTAAACGEQRSINTLHKYTQQKHALPLTDSENPSPTGSACRFPLHPSDFIDPATSLRRRESCAPRTPLVILSMAQNTGSVCRNQHSRALAVSETGRCGSEADPAQIKVSLGSAF